MRHCEPSGLSTELAPFAHLGPKASAEWMFDTPGRCSASLVDGLFWEGDRVPAVGTITGVAVRGGWSCIPGSVCRLYCRCLGLRAS